MGQQREDSHGFFIFLFFNFVLYKNIFLFSKFTGIYPGCRAAGTPLPGGRGFSTKTFTENLRPGPWRTGHPAAGRPALQAARQWGGLVLAAR